MVTWSHGEEDVRDCLKLTNGSCVCGSVTQDRMYTVQHALAETLAWLRDELLTARGQQLRARESNNTKTSSSSSSSSGDGGSSTGAGIASTEPLLWLPADVDESALRNKVHGQRYVAHCMARSVK